MKVNPNVSRGGGSIGKGYGHSLNCKAHTNNGAKGATVFHGVERRFAVFTVISQEYFSFAYRQRGACECSA